jgi:hypothetical protein
VLQSLVDRVASVDASDESDREQLIASWIARQTTSWITSAIVLGSTFCAMLLLALSRA